MLKHIVLFKFKPSSSENKIDEIVHLFKNLRHSVSEILDFEWGNNESPENHHQGFTHCFTLTFESLKTLETYQSNRYHKEFQKVLLPHLENVFVVDYYIQN